MPDNALYYGDNLEILRKYAPDESVDLVYLDPPFNSNATYNVLFKEPSGELSTAQLQAFSDTWHWDLSAESTFRQIVEGPLPQVARMISALREFLGSNDMMAYIVMMTPRLLELRRVLRPTGTVYLHCDPTASHYLKIVMDTIFGANHFLNEIIWHYLTSGGAPKKTLIRDHDTILRYSKASAQNVVWNAPREPWPESTLRKWQRDEDGRIYHVHNDTGRRYYIDPAGKLMDDVWDITLAARSSERLGYPTQKPEALLERIIAASSLPGSVVLDPFCGCGTAVVAAQKLGRRWIGIDLTHLAITVMKKRLSDQFGLTPGSDYEVIGEPKDMTGAHALAEQDRYQFQWWALSLIRASPVGDERKKGADRGIDGLMTFVETGGKAKVVVVSVKSGHVNAAQVRDLRGAMERERADLGLFVTLEPSTGPMRAEAAAAGLYRSDLWQADFPRIQICMVEELLGGRLPRLPKWSAGGFAHAARTAEVAVQTPLLR